MNPREIRLLKALFENEKVSVKDLRSVIGALNPAQVVLVLRRRGWDIRTQYISIRDRDGVVCHPGCYWLDDKEKERVRQFFEEASGAGDAAPSAIGDLKCSDIQISNLDRIKGEEK